VRKSVEGPALRRRKFVFQLILVNDDDDDDDDNDDNPGLYMKTCDI
jgi:hypothetical protein